MSFYKKGLSVLGKLLIVVSLSAAFFVGLFGVIYLQLSGKEVEIPKIVGLNYNDGEDELAQLGLRIRKIATRYSKESPNTILEQRPRAGSVAKSGLLISVVVSEPNPDGDEPVPEIKDDEEAIEEIEDLPELETVKPKKKPKKEEGEPASKTRDIVEETPPPKETAPKEEPAADAQNKPEGKDSGTTPDKNKPGDKKPAPIENTIIEIKKPPKPVPKPPKAKTGGDTRPRKTPVDN